MMENITLCVWMVLLKSMVGLISLCPVIYLWTNKLCPVETPAELNFSAVRQTLMRIVPLCLDSDPSLIPLSCKDDKTPTLEQGPSISRVELDPPERAADFDSQSDMEERGPDPDDFSFWSELQAKRICSAIKEAFGVEYAPEVVLGDANLSALANRILLSKQM